MQTAFSLTAPEASLDISECKNGSIQQQATTNIWQKNVENAFQEALYMIPTETRHTRFMASDGKIYGRNELISKHIFNRTGQMRSRKQISSHLQVLRNKAGELKRRSSTPKSYKGADERDHSFRSETSPRSSISGSSSSSPHKWKGVVSASSYSTIAVDEDDRKNLRASEMQTSMNAKMSDVKFTAEIPFRDTVAYFDHKIVRDQANVEHVGNLYLLLQAVSAVEDVRDSPSNNSWLNTVCLASAELTDDLFTVDN